MVMIGVCNGNSQEQVLSFERWLGRDVDFHLQFLGENSWEELKGSTLWALNRYPDLPQPILWSVPLLTAGATLENAAMSMYDVHYRNVAQSIISGKANGDIYIRTGWEQNGSWTKWAALGKERDYIEAFKSFVRTFRGVSGRFKFIWCPNIGQDDPSKSYPGDEFVDVVGLDVYHQPQWDPIDASDAWQYQVRRKYGLQWHLEFCQVHSKLMAFPEWGVRADNFDIYVSNMYSWIHSSHALLHAYWDSNSDYPGKLSSGQYPSTGSIFKKLFSQE